MFKLIFLVCVFNLVLCEKNTTCPDKRICFSYTRYEEHCELYIGCNPPCDLQNCSIIVENDVECEHFVCFNFPDPAPNKISIGWDLLYGSIGSISTSLAMIFFWFSIKKLLLRRRRRNHSRLIDDIIINDQETSREIEGDAISRPIIISDRGLQEQELHVPEPQIKKDLSVRPKEKKESAEASCSNQNEIKVFEEDTNNSFENPFYKIKPNFRPIFEESNPQPVHDKYDSSPPSMDSIIEDTPNSL